MTPQPSPSATTPTDTPTDPSLLDAVIGALPAARPQEPPAPGQPLVGDCLDANHPTLLGRFLIRYPDTDGRPAERWLAGLYGLPVRAHDRVLLVRPANWPEPLIVGVIDGFAHRPEPAAVVGAAVSLLPDEVVRVQGSRGEPLVEVRQSATGPVVRFLTDDVQLEMPGKLGIAAKSIDLKATFGAVNITATEDVVVTGESIKLN